MDETTIQLHTAFCVGEVDPRLFGGFLEHIIRSIDFAGVDSRNGRARVEHPPLSVVAMTLGL